MILNRRRNKQVYGLFFITIISIILFLKNVPFAIKNHPTFDYTQIIKPLDESLLFPIHGHIKYLGEASSIYIINLPSRFDRRIESIALMQTLNLQAFIVPAYSIQSPEIFILNQYRNRFFLKLTELACWASHIRTWITIANHTYSKTNYTWSIIVEDDIDLEIDTPYIMQTFPYSIWNDADLIYLGHCANPPGELIFESSKHIYRIHKAVYPSCTHAYVIRSDTARKLINLISKPLRPIDDSIVKFVHDQRLVAYSIHPPLAIQKLVTKSNPSDVNKINRQSLIYRIQFTIYTFLQWLNGVKPYDKLKKPTLRRANFTKAKYWIETYENTIRKNFTLK